MVQIVTMRLILKSVAPLTTVRSELTVIISAIVLAIVMTIG
jgi:hypothetical protein